MVTGIPIQAKSGGSCAVRVTKEAFPRLIYLAAAATRAGSGQGVPGSGVAARDRRRKRLVFSAMGGNE